MIAGHGIDIAEIARIRNSLARFGETFAEKVFTLQERREAALRKDPAVYYAGRWAAKEAVSKALGCGMGGKCSWLDVETLNNASGSPEIVLSGQARRTFESLGADAVHISISHEASYAVASVILEKIH